MLRNFLDLIIDTKPTSVILVLAHVAALTWAVRLHKGTRLALVLNLIVSSVILTYNADHLGIMLRYSDWTLLALMAFALVAFLASAGALSGLRIPVWLNWTAFAVNFVLSVLLMAVMFLFKVTRLF